MSHNLFCFQTSFIFDANVLRNVKYEHLHHISLSALTAFDLNALCWCFYILCRIRRRKESYFVLDYKGHIFKRGRECDLTHCQMSNVNDSCLQQIQRKASPEFWHSFQDKGDFILYWKLIWNASYENITRVQYPISWPTSSSSSIWPSVPLLCEFTHPSYSMCPATLFSSSSGFHFHHPYHIFVMVSVII